MDISQFLVDDELAALRGSFLVSGRSSPKKTRNSLACTKRLLIQLKTLCDERNERYSDVFAWFCELFPDTKVAQSKFIKQVQQTLTIAQKILAERGADELRTFLDSSHDVFFVADALTAIGITMRELDDPLLFKSLPNNFDITNRAVLQLEWYHRRNNLKFSIMTMWMNHLLSESYSEKILSSALKHLIKESKIRRARSARKLEYQQFLNSRFQGRLVAPSQDTTITHPPQEPPTNSSLLSTVHPFTSAKIITELQQSLEKCQEEISILKNKLQEVTEQHQATSQNLVYLQTENGKLNKLVAALSEKLTESLENQKEVTKY